MKTHVAYNSIERIENMNAASHSHPFGGMAAAIYDQASDSDPTVKTFGQPRQAENIKQIRTEAEFKAVLARLEPQELSQLYLFCTRDDPYPNGALRKRGDTTNKSPAMAHQSVQYV